MRPFQLTALIAMAAVGATTSGADPAGQEERVFVGYAYDREDGALVYREVHREIRAERGGVDLETTYLEPDGDLIADRRVAFSSHRFAPSFTLDDRRTGYVEGAAREDGELVVFRREPNDAAIEERVVESTGGLVVDAGFDRFIVANWERLLAGRPLVAEFVVPSRLRALDFKVRKHGEVFLQGQPAVTFRMTISNPVFRLFVPPIDVTYHAGDRFLMRYEGISNIRDRDGTPYEVRIDFPLEERSDWRRPGAGQG